MMDALLIDGGHLCDSLGSPIMVGGERELLQRAAIRLAVRRGSLPHDPAFGSTLHRLDTDGPAGARDARALAAARLALAPLPQFEVRAAECAWEPGARRLTVRVTLALAGRDYQLEVDV